MIAPKRIILEDTGERRYPKGNEPYLFIRPGFRPLDDNPLDRLCTADNYDDLWGGDPEDYIIYRIVDAEETERVSAILDQVRSMNNGVLEAE